MTTETVAPVTTDTLDTLSQQVTSVKPYDDAMLEEYVKDEAAPAEATESTDNGELPKGDEPPTDAPKDAENPEETETPAGERKGDKVEDNFEAVKVTKEINGKKVEFTVADAIEAKVKQEEFNRNMDRRIGELSHREKKFKEGQENFKGKILKVLDAAQGGDFIYSVRALAKLAKGTSDLDVVEFEKKYFSQLDKAHEVLTKMTPEQQEAYWAKREAQAAKAKAHELEEEKNLNQGKSQLQETVQSLQQQFGLSEPEFWESYKILESNQVGEGKRFKNVHEIQPQDVVEIALAVRHEEKVLTAGQKLGIEDDDELLDEVSRITSTDPSLTVEDIITIIEKAGLGTTASPQAVENLNRKAEKNRTQFSKASSTKKEDKIDGLDKEDLDFLYRNQPKAYQRPVR